MGGNDVEEICERYLSRREERNKVVEAVQRCLKKGYDYEKMKDRVLSSVSDAHKAHKVISAFEESKDDYKSKRDRFDRDRDREREKKERDRERERDRRKREDEANEKEQEKEREKEKLKNLAKELYQKKLEEEDAKKNVVVTEETLRWRLMIGMKKYITSIFVVYYYELSQQTFRNIYFRQDEELLEFLDPRIKSRPAERKRRMFAFHEKGEFEKMANKQRAMAKLERLQAEISQAAKSTGISSAVKLAMVTPAGKSSDVVPDIEWWDSIVLENESYEGIPNMMDESRFADTISELVEHPIKLRPPNDPLTPQYLKVYLTSKERKKIRRQNRKEMQKERTEKIRLGLEKAPAPKVKISNLMRVLGTDAVQDPTKMEAHVRKQMAERLRKHQQEELLPCIIIVYQANAERKLTDDQKAAKKAKKISEDTSLAVNVAVYRFAWIKPSSYHIGPKQQKFYNNLMMSRIKWEDEVIGQKKDAEKDAPGERNHCQLIWEGQVKRRNFRDFTVVTATIEKQARELFEKHNVAQYWDLAYSTTVLLDGQDPVPT
uniref:Pre-mRNA processing factor 3 n=1 Tax=Heterorhabditis bacteriophora TaxID=37862 RepID=A0A1I7XTJ1_HETBA